MGPPPWTQVDPSRCLSRRRLGLVTLGGGAADGLDAHCRIDEAAARRQQAPVLALLDEVARQADVPIFQLHPLLCQDGRCATEQDGLPLYRDARHLSHEGAAQLGRRWQLGQRLAALAR